MKILVVHISLHLDVLKKLGRYPEEELLSHVIALFLIFEETP